MYIYLYISELGRRTVNHQKRIVPKIFNSTLYYYKIDHHYYCYVTLIYIEKTRI